MNTLKRGDMVDIRLAGATVGPIVNGTLYVEHPSTGGSYLAVDPAAGVSLTEEAAPQPDTALVVRPGDTLIVGFNRLISAEHADRAREVLIGRLPDLTDVLVVGECSALAAYRPEPSSQAEQYGPAEDKDGAELYHCRACDLVLGWARGRFTDATYCPDCGATDWVQLYARRAGTS